MELFKKIIGGLISFFIGIGAAAAVYFALIFPFIDNPMQEIIITGILFIGSLVFIAMFNTGRIKFDITPMQYILVETFAYGAMTGCGGTLFYGLYKINELAAQ